jgi:hypothetical protein
VQVLTGAKVKLGSWTEYLALLRLNATHRALLSNDLLDCLCLWVTPVVTPGAVEGFTGRALVQLFRRSNAAFSFAESLAEVEAEAVVAIPLGRLHLVEFVGDHCTVCTRMAPVVKRLERACSQGDGSVVHVNVESPAGRALSQRLNVHAVRPSCSSTRKARSWSG